MLLLLLLLLLLLFQCKRDKNVNFLKIFLRFVDVFRTKENS